MEVNPSVTSLSTTGQADRVTVMDINMPFWSMVVFMIKWVFASIAAMIVLGICGALLAGVIGGIFGNFNYIFNNIFGRMF